MSKIILFNKPYGTLCQFTGEEHDATLANFIDVPDVYAVGRLDKDSEGLLVLTDDGKLQHRLSDPEHKVWKTYWVQVDAIPDDDAISALCKGVQLQDGMTRPAQVKHMDTPDVWDRTPPVRVRKHIPTSWLEVKLREGRNRQVRRMTADVGHPTLRLIRVSVGPWNLSGLNSGEWREA